MLNVEVKTNTRSAFSLLHKKNIEYPALCVARSALRIF